MCQKMCAPALLACPLAMGATHAGVGPPKWWCGGGRLLFWPILGCFLTAHSCPRACACPQLHNASTTHSSDHLWPVKGSTSPQCSPQAPKMVKKRPFCCFWPFFSKKTPWKCVNHLVLSSMHPPNTTASGKKDRMSKLKKNIYAYGLKKPAGHNCSIW